MRALVGSEAAMAKMRDLAHGRVRALAPDLVYAEVANALLGYVRSGTRTLDDALEALRYIGSLPIEPMSTRRLIAPALLIAAAKAVSAYDALYLALAETLDATLITADRRLGAVATLAEVID